MKKGFTLIELLGVIVLLSIIMVLVMPNIINSIKKANQDQDTYNSSIIYKAVDTYIQNNEFYKENKNNTYCIPINKLVNLGLLQSPVSYNGNNSIEDTMSVKATYNNKWNYSILSNSECSSNTVAICNKTTASTVTTGFVPANNYTAGDEYICNLSSNLSYHFFILNVNGDKVSLIAKNNLGSNGALTSSTTNSKWYSSATNSNGPLTAYTYISTNTSAWVNIYTIKNFNFIDNNKDNDECGYNGIFVRKDGNNYTTTIINKSGSNKVTYTNLKARMPLLSEMFSIGCTTTNNSCPAWLVGNFYLNDSYNSANNRAYYISNNRSITSSTVNTDAGVRPVIELYKSDLE